MLPIRVRMGEKEKENSECPICYENIEENDTTITNCNHKYCTECVKRLITETTPHRHPCPLCRTEIVEVKVCSYESYYNIVSKMIK